MKPLPLALLLACALAPTSVQAQHAGPFALGHVPLCEAVVQADLLREAIAEVDLALDAYFALIDDDRLALFVEAVSHAARGRVLLERYLGETDVGWTYALAQEDDFRGEVATIALYAGKFTGAEAQEMWRRDYAFDAFPKAKQRLAEWDVTVKGFKRHYLGME